METQELKNQIKKELQKQVDINYQKFHSSLCPGITNILGVRIPQIRKLAKELLKNYNFEELYLTIDNEYYEEIMLKGMIIGLQKEPFSKTKNYIKDFVPLINNWAICDTFCAGLKTTKKNSQEMRDFILTYQSSNKEFELRFMLVMIQDYYITKEYLAENFKIISQIKNTNYYVEMALAWLLSTSLIKFYDETLEYLKENKLTDFVHNKTISKACDSYRISKEQKEELKKLRR